MDSFPHGLAWPDLVALVIVSAPGIIAAVSSLRNGKLLKKNGAPIDAKVALRPLGRKPVEPNRTPKKPEKLDWYKPPSL